MYYFDNPGSLSQSPYVKLLWDCNLAEAYTPPPGAGRYWIITDIAGSTIKDVNELTNTP